VGDDVLLLSRLVGPAGLICAVEAHPETFRCLIKTIAKNDLKNVIPVHAAVADFNGELFIEDNADLHFANRVSDTGIVKVRAITLETLLTEVHIDRVSLAKMNIEGAETAALRGAGSSLDIIDNWVISCHDFISHVSGYESSATKQDVTSLLRNAGYSIFMARVDNRPWIPDYVYASRTAIR
jgi:FkbM family methyltransferase